MRRFLPHSPALAAGTAARVVASALALAVAAAAALFAAVAAPTAARAAASGPIFSLDDPRGDDHGDGSLRYPLRNDLAPGDLDLLSLSARAEKGRTTFEATFARPIRTPGREPVDVGGTALDRVARFGFYTFNLDLYIDTDRVPGSGRRAMLPGRKAEVDSTCAWERAICLTPRPYQALEALRDLRYKATKDSIEKSAPRVDDEELARSSGRSPRRSTRRFSFRRASGSSVRESASSFPTSSSAGPHETAGATSRRSPGRTWPSGSTWERDITGASDFAAGLMIVPIAPGGPTSVSAAAARTTISCRRSRTS